MKELKHYIIIGIIFVLITGTLSHFVYEWSGNNFIAGFFFPVSESTWEHMKLCFFPMLFYSVYMDKKLAPDYPCITSSSLLGILAGTFLIPVIFYTYTGILGRNFLVLDVGTFIASVLLAFAVVYRFTMNCKGKDYTFLLKICVLILAVCFFIFTYHPANLGIFADPTI